MTLLIHALCVFSTTFWLVLDGKIMNIDSPIRPLGMVEIQALQSEILSQEEDAWFEQEYRQKEYDVHLYTQ